MRTIDFDQRLADLDNRALPFEGKPIAHLKDIVVFGLLQAPGQGDGLEMHRRYKLAQRIKKGGKINVEDEDLKRIRHCVALTSTTIAVGLVYDMLGEKDGG